MIVRILGEGQLEVPDSEVDALNDLDDAIAHFVRAEHGLAVGEQTAEDIKLTLGSAASPREAEVEVRGRDLSSGLPKSVCLQGEEIRRALDEPLRAIVGAVKDTLEETPPELSSDIINDGMLLAGGGCLLRGFVERLTEETATPARLAESPLTTVVEGAGRSLDEIGVVESKRRTIPVTLGR